MITRYTIPPHFCLILLTLSSLTPALSTSSPLQALTPHPTPSSVDYQPDSIWLLADNPPVRRQDSSPRSRGSLRDYVEHQGQDLRCRPFGQCQPCPADELNEPFCLPFGNRRLLHCSKDGDKTQGEIPAWEACGRVIEAEQRRFWEFVTLNLLLLIVALVVLWARTSALAAHQYRQLAARIGIPSGGWRT